MNAPLFLQLQARLRTRLQRVFVHRSPCQPKPWRRLIDAGGLPSPDRGWEAAPTEGREQSRPLLSIFPLTNSLELDILKCPKKGVNNPPKRRSYEEMATFMRSFFPPSAFKSFLDCNAISISDIFGIPISKAYLITIFSISISKGSFIPLTP